MITKGQSKAPWSKSIYGVSADEETFNRASLKMELETIELLKEDFLESKFWPFYKEVLYFDKNADRAHLFNTELNKEMVFDTSSKLIELSLTCKDKFSNLKKV